MTTVERYITEHGTYNNISKPRVQASRRVLGQFETFCGCPPEQASARQFEEFLAGELARGLTPTTVQFNGNLIRPFFTWAWKQGIVDADSLMRIRAVRDPAGAGPGQPRPYSRKELDRLWRDLDNSYPLTPVRLERWHRRGLRYRMDIYRHLMHLQMEAIIRLALDCGMRRSEILRVDLEDMHHDNQYVVVRKGKNGKFREVPHTPASREAVRVWLDARYLYIRPNHDCPWVNLDPQGPSWVGLPISERRFGLLLHGLGGWEYHRLRHTCATEWLRAGMDLELVSRLLGHSGLTMTLRYAELIPDDIFRASGRAWEKFERAVGRR